MDAPCFSYVDDECCMKSALKRQWGSANYVSTKSIRWSLLRDRQSVAPYFLYVTAHVKSIRLDK
jgi:hypothetical protein